VPERIDSHIAKKITTMTRAMTTLMTIAMTASCDNDRVLSSRQERMETPCSV